MKIGPGLTVETLVSCAFVPGTNRVPDSCEDKASIDKWVPVLTVTEHSCIQFVWPPSCHWSQRDPLWAGSANQRIAGLSQVKRVIADYENKVNPDNAKMTAKRAAQLSTPQLQDMVDITCVPALVPKEGLSLPKLLRTRSRLSFSFRLGVFCNVQKILSF